MSKDKFNEILKDLATQKQSVIEQTEKLEEKKNNRILSLDSKDPNYKAFEPEIKKLNDKIKADEKKIGDSKKKIESGLSSAKTSRKKELNSRAKILVEAVKVEDDKIKEEVEKIEKEQEELNKKRSETVKKIADLKKKKGSNDPNIDVNAIDGEITALEKDAKMFANQHADNDLRLTFLKMSKQQLMDEYMEIKDEISKVNALTYDDFDKEFKEKEEKPVQTQTQNQTQTQGQPYQYYGQPVYGGYDWSGQQPMQQPAQQSAQTQNNGTRTTQEAKEPIAPKPDPTKHQEPPKRDKNQKVEVKLNDDGTITYKYGDINATYNLKDYKASKADVIARAKRNFGNEGKEIAEERIEPLLMKFILEKVKDGQLYNSLLKKYMDGEDLDKKFAQYDMTNVKPATFFLSDDKWAEVAEKAADSGFEVKGYVSKKQLEKQKKEAKERKEAKKEAKKENELPKGYTYKDFCEKCKNGKNPLGEKWDKFFKTMVDKGSIDKAEVEQEKEKIYNSLLQEVRKQMKDTKTVDIYALSRNAKNWGEKEIKLPSGEKTKLADACVTYLFQESYTTSKIFEYIKKTLPKKEQTQIDVDKIKYLEDLRKEEAETKKKARNQWKVDDTGISAEINYSKFYIKQDDNQKPLGEKWDEIHKANKKEFQTEQNTYNALIKCVVNKMKDNTRPISTNDILTFVESELAKCPNGRNEGLEKEFLNSVLDDEDGLKKMLKYVKESLSQEEQEKVNIDEIKTISEENEEKEKQKDEEEKTNAG